MHIPVRFFTRQSVAALAVVVMGALGCNQSATSHITSPERLEGSLSTIDARGASVDSRIIHEQHVVGEGAAGNGGTIRVISAAGDVEIRSRARTFTPPVGALDLSTGNGLTIASGETRKMSGGWVFDFMNIASGGELVLTDNATFVIFGDVLIAGDVSSKPNSGQIRRDGHDFSLDAGGTVIITGKVDSSGQNARSLAPSEQAPGSEDDSEPREKVTLGGNGGDVFVSADGDIFITGAVLADGGGSDSQDPLTGISGQGGQMLMGTEGDFFIAGRLSARAGNSYTNGVTLGPTGGQIELVAQGDILIEEVATVNATGGRNSGQQAGDGGSVTIEAPTGDAVVEGIEIDASGGRLNFNEGGTAGPGGALSVTGQQLTLTNSTLLANSGDIVDDAKGIGSLGGTITLSGSTLIEVQDTLFEGNGGDSLGSTFTAGDGGKFFIIANSFIDPSIATINFTGDSIGIFRGGENFGGQEAALGEACVTGLLTSNSIVRIIGVNDFPLGGCTQTAYEDFAAIVHDIDCDDGSIRPNQNVTTLPAVLGRDFYRVFVGDASSVNITTAGERNIDLFAGETADVGDPNIASYEFSSREANSSESILIDNCSTPSIANLASGGFISVLVAEQAGLIEEYTISMSCAEIGETLGCGQSDTFLFDDSGDSAEYRVNFGTSSSVTIATSGTGLGVDLYAGVACSLGSTDTNDYTSQSETVGNSTESITLTGGALATTGAGGFISVLITTTSDVPETVTLTITCLP